MCDLRAFKFVGVASDRIIERNESAMNGRFAQIVCIEMKMNEKATRRGEAKILRVYVYLYRQMW
jgi:hypothetical protein